MNEEIADVTITLEQIVIIFDGELVVPLEIEEKLKRLQEEVK